MKLKSSPWAALAVAGSAQFLVLLETTVVTVAVPTIAARLGDAGWLPWVLSGYLLAFGGFLLPGGAWADRYGRRRMFLAGLTAFALTSVMCAFAPVIELLVAARVLQGASAGVLAASALGVVLADYTAERERAVAMTVWSALGVVGAVVGSLAAGPVIAWLGWPGVFWVNVIAVAVLLPFARRSVSPDEAIGAAMSPQVGWALLAALGAALVLAGLSVAEVQALLAVGIAAVGAAVVAGVVRQQLRATRPILPVRLFRLPAYRHAVTGLFLTNGLMISAMYAYSRHLQDGYGLSAQQASLGVLPMALASLVVAFAADLLITRLGEVAVLRLGAGLLMVGTLGFLLTTVVGGWALLVLSGVLLGAGLPACFVVLNRRAFGAVEVAESGTASGFTNTVTTLGGASAVALTALGSGLMEGQTGAYLILTVIAMLIGALAV